MLPKAIVKTRFGIRHRGNLPDEEWIQSRFELMKRVTYPSLLKQTHQGFVWMVLTSPHWYNRVYKMFNELPLPDSQTVIIAEQKEMQGLDAIHPGVDDTVTIRLDCDDALFPNTIQSIVDACAGSTSDMLLDMPCGVQWNIETGNMAIIKNRPHYQGPFLAVRSTSRDRIGYTAGHHVKSRDEFDCVVTVEGIRWIQTINGSNWANQSEENIVRRVYKKGLRVASAIPPVRRMGLQFPHDDVLPVPDYMKADFLAEMPT